MGNCLIELHIIAKRQEVKGASCMLDGVMNKSIWAFFEFDGKLYVRCN